MLTLPQGPPIYRVMGIDPGTDTLGLAVLDMNMITGFTTVVGAMTYSGHTLSRQDDRWFGDIHGQRAARLRAHQINLYEVFDTWTPHCVIAESPFMSKFPQAFMALVECLDSIRAALYHYDRMMPLLTVDPPSAKKSTGMTGKLSGKEGVKLAIAQIPYLLYAPGLSLSAMDEHTVDAIAVAHYRVRSIMGFSPLPDPAA